MAEFAAGPGDSTGADDKYVGCKAVMSYSKYLSNNREARRRSAPRAPSPPPPRDSAISSEDESDEEKNSDGEKMSEEMQESLEPESSSSSSFTPKEPVVASDWLGRLAHKVTSSAAFAALKHILTKMQDDHRMTVTGDQNGRMFRDGEDCGLSLARDLVKLVRSMTAPLPPGQKRRPALPESVQRALKLLKVWKFAPSRWRPRPSSGDGKSRKRKASPSTDTSEAKRVKRAQEKGRDDDWYKL